MSKVYLLIAFLVLGKSMSAQTPLETLLHLDKSYYVSGEVVWFKLYLPVTWQGKNIAVNTTLLGHEGNILDRFFLETREKSFVHGYYRIPFDQATGSLEIQFAASAGSETEEQLIAHYSFPVYNDLENTNDLIVEDQRDRSSDPELFYNEFQIDLNLSSDLINRRDEVDVEVVIKDKNGSPVTGHASVTVKDASLTQPINGYRDIMTLPLSYTVSPLSLQSAIYCRGTLRNPDGGPLQMNVLGGYIGDDQKIYYSKSFKEGNFQIDLPRFTGKKNIQLLGFQYEKPDLRSKMQVPVRIDNEHKVVYSEEVLEYIHLSRLRKKIFQYYEVFEMELDVDEIKIETQVLKPDASYSVKEYESFKDMKSFFGELLTPLRFKLEKDSLYTASLFNAKGGQRSNTILNGPPLFMIDGKMTRNADFVAKLPVSAIETVDLFLDAPKLRSYFQAIGVSGLVRISTSIANLKLPSADAGNIHHIYGLQPEASFPIFKPESSIQRQPFFRPQIYWVPDLMINGTGPTSFSFVQSDDIGPFEIKLVFQSDDGRRASRTYQYQVTY